MIRLSQIRVLLLLSVCVYSGVWAQEEDEEEQVEFAFKNTQSIANTLFHETCDVTSGSDFLFLSCQNTFEIYNTADLAKGTGLTQNFGEANPAVGVHHSLATADYGSVTYVHFARGINRVSRDAATNQLVKETIVNLVIPSYDTATDAFVFNDMVAVQLNDGPFSFFQIPLIKGTFVEALQMSESYLGEQDFANDFYDLRAYAFAPNGGNSTYVMFGVLQDRLVRITYTYDQESGNITQDVFRRSHSFLNGTLVDMVVTAEEVVVSVANGPEPMVVFFNHDLEDKKQYPRRRQENSKINLAVSKQESTIIQVILSSPQSISVIQRAITSNGDYVYELLSDIYDEGDGVNFMSNTTDTLYVSKGDEYLVFKKNTQDYLGIIPVCTQNTIFDPATFSCSPCQQGLRSYGLQEDECLSCMRMWLGRTSTEFANHLWNELCTEGNVFSIVLLVLVPVITCLVACVCCFCSKSNGLRDKTICDVFEEEEAERQKQVTMRKSRSRRRRRPKSTGGETSRNMVNVDGTPNDDELAQIEAMQNDIAKMESQRRQKAPGFGSQENPLVQPSNKRVDGDQFSDTDPEYFEGDRGGELDESCQAESALEKGGIDKGDLPDIRQTVKSNFRQPKTSVEVDNPYNPY